MNRRVLLTCAWCGPFLAVAFAVGFVLLAGWIPPPAPGDNAREIAGMYRDNLTAIRFGMVFCIASLTLMGPWAVAIAVHTWRSEKGAPVFALIQVFAVAVGAAVTVAFCVIYATAAYRAGEIPPEITRSLNDLGWFFFLFTWPPFALWAVAIGVPILMDDAETPVFPRWAGYFNLWAALLFAPAGLMAFFKSGAFAWNGLVALYIPFTVFMIWLVVMTVLVIQAVNRRRETVAEPADMALAAPVTG